MPVEGLLYVGPATKNKFNRYCIDTIGNLAQISESFLRGLLGKAGSMLNSFANGLDQSRVMNIDEQSCIKSIGNSTTAPRGLVNDKDIKAIVFVLTKASARGCGSTVSEVAPFKFQCGITSCFDLRDRQSCLSLNVSQMTLRLRPWPCSVSTISASVTRQPSAIGRIPCADNY